MSAQIEKLRKELKGKVQMADQDFLHSSVLSVSQKLDKLIVEKMKKIKK